eukprot:CAMPEP_0119075426 /NCGR_PEP_ID=MMETSP1178-20130426/80145_1 /TAXON_ID=33656 /ORGANISM="unid sp, Strain CCMP2000" /LENGTH=238 /DNA_ID=CAMNT_0007057647 /DNA_START=21 /DNA_END=737 /DNA_ORIENTATION=+
MWRPRLFQAMTGGQRNQGHAGLTAFLSRSLVTRWQQAASAVRPEKLLPPGLGGSADVKRDVDVAAFYGDKLLGAAVALAQRRVKVGEHTVGSLTRLQNVATSNAFLKSNIATLLPQHAHMSESSAHDIGTMVEAAVDAVHTEGDMHAIDELARWLVQTAREMDGLHSAFDNAKGRLLEMGGTVTSERVGGADHRPIFKAVAQLGVKQVSATEQGSKRCVEQQVSRRLLRCVSTSPDAA